MDNKNGQFKDSEKRDDVPRPENATREPEVDLRNEIKKGRESTIGQHYGKKENK
jgi:hypothetical protein